MSELLVIKGLLADAMAMEGVFGVPQCEVEAEAGVDELIGEDGP